MKVLLFSNVVPGKAGAYEYLLGMLGRVFCEAGDSVVYGLGGAPIESVRAEWVDSGVQWRVVDGWIDERGHERPWGFVWGALRLVQEEHADVCAIHFGDEWPALATSVLLRLVGGSDVASMPRWVWQQDQQMRDPNWLSRRISRVGLLKLAFTHFVAMYEGGKSSLVLRGIPEERVSVICNSIVDCCREKKSGWLRQELRIPFDVAIVMSVGSLIPRKRHEFAIRGVAELGGAPSPSLSPEGRGSGFATGSPAGGRTGGVHLVIVGEGPERGALEGLVRQLGVDDRVHFLGLRNDVRELLFEADLQVHTAAAEACAYSVLEGMAASLPVVMTDAGAAREQVAQGESGYVVGRDDFEGFVVRLTELLADAGKRARFGAAGRQRFLMKYRVEDAARKYHALYKRLAGE